MPLRVASAAHHLVLRYLRRQMVELRQVSLIVNSTEIN